MEFGKAISLVHRWLLAQLSLCFILRQLLPMSVSVSIAIEETLYHGNSYKGKHLVVVALQFRSLVHCHDGKQGSMQTDVVLERELSVLHLDL